MESDQAAEREVDRWFGAQRQSLRAPSDLWDKIKPQLGSQVRGSAWKRLFAIKFAIPVVGRHPVVFASFVGVLILAAVAVVAAGPSLFTAERSRETIYAGLQESSSTQNQSPSATAVPRAGLPGASGAQRVPGASTNTASPRPAGGSDATAIPGLIPGTLTREQAEDLVLLALPGGYGMTEEQYERILSRIMAGDLDGLDVDNLPLSLTTFQDYGVNPFVETAVERFSTFAMDVDTASYTVGRGYLQDGRTPPPSSVRVEEYINYFDQDYPAASEGLSGHIDGAISPYADDGRYLLRVGVNAMDVDPMERKSANIILVIDRSGSMGNSNRIRLVQQGVLELLSRLQEDDTVGIVTYNTEATLELRPTSNFRQAESVVFELQPDGGTSVQAGLQLGFQLAEDAFSSDKSNHVILLSDGVANHGETEASRLLDEVREYARDGVSLSTIGVGLGNFNDVLLEQLANNGDGSYAYIDTDDEARKTLGTGITGLLETVAKDAKVQLEFNTETVESYRLVGYENRSLETEEFRDDSVDAGEVGAGHTVTAMYELRLRDSDAGASLGTLRLRWLDPETGEAIETFKNIARSDVDRPFESASPRFRVTASVMAYAELLRRSPWFAEVSMQDVASTLRSAVADLGDAADENELLRLLDNGIELGLLSQD